MPEAGSVELNEVELIQTQPGGVGTRCAACPPEGSQLRRFRVPLQVNDELLAKSSSLAPAPKSIVEATVRLSVAAAGTWLKPPGLKVPPAMTTFPELKAFALLARMVPWLIVVPPLCMLAGRAAQRQSASPFYQSSRSYQVASGRAADADRHVIGTIDGEIPPLLLTVDRPAGWFPLKTRFPLAALNVCAAPAPATPPELNRVMDTLKVCVFSSLFSTPFAAPPARF